MSSPYNIVTVLLLMATSRGRVCIAMIMGTASCSIIKDFISATCLIGASE